MVAKFFRVKINNGKTSDYVGKLCISNTLKWHGCDKAKLEPTKLKNDLKLRGD